MHSSSNSNIFFYKIKYFIQLQILNYCVWLAKHTVGRKKITSKFSLVGHMSKFLLPPPSPSYGQVVLKKDSHQSSDSLNAPFAQINVKSYDHTVTVLIF